MSSDDVLTVPGPVQLQLRTTLVLEQAPILRWRFHLGVAVKTTTIYYGSTLGLRQRSLSNS